MATDVIIVGAGLSGLVAAIELQKAGKKVKVLEATEIPGGRVSSETVDGFILDKGFQVFLTAYPDAPKYLDYNKLRLQHFTPGAMLLKDGKKYRIGDPFRNSSLLLPTLLSPVGSLNDKLKLLLLQNSLKNKKVVDIFKQEEKSSMSTLLKEYNFSDKMIRNFFRPFFSGIFLENELETSRRMMDFTFKMFAEGFASIPELGMREIPLQLAEKLKPGTIRYNSRVKEVHENYVELTNGEQLQTSNVLLATESCGLLKDYLPEIKTSCHGTTNIYFSADKTPVKGPILVLNSNKEKFINNLAVMSEVSNAYAPAKKSLISVSLNSIIEENTQAAIQKVKQELTPYFGKEVQNWHHVKTYKIRYALPDQKHVQHQIAESSIIIREGLFMCGDHLLNGSINGAMRSGEFAAGVILRQGH